MEELSDADRLTVQRARKIQRFFSQPFFVAEQFTGAPGRYVKREETVRSFKEIIEGRCDDVPEQAFYMVGTIEEVHENAKKLAGVPAKPDAAAKPGVPAKPDAAAKPASDAKPAATAKPASDAKAAAKH
jgi:hypothetical protein